MTQALVLAVFLGGLLWMDRVFVFQFMLSRPVVMGAVLGSVMGDTATGLLVGMSLELLWLSAPPVGAYLPNDESFCTAVCVPVAVVASHHLDAPAAAGLAVLVCLPCSIAGRFLDMKIRTLNEGLLGGRDHSPAEHLAGAVGASLARAYALAVVSIGALTAALGLVADVVSSHMPRFFVWALWGVPLACVVGGLASLVGQSRPRAAHAVMFSSGIALAALLTWIS